MARAGAADEIDREECLRLAVKLLKLHHHDPDLYRVTVSLLHSLHDRMEEGRLLEDPGRRQKPVVGTPISTGDAS